MFRLTSFVFLHVTLWLDTHVWSPCNAHIDSACAHVVPIEFHHSLQRLCMKKRKKKNPFTCLVCRLCSTPDISTVRGGCRCFFLLINGMIEEFGPADCISHDVRMQGSCRQKRSKCEYTCCLNKPRLYFLFCVFFILPRDAARTS